MLRDWHSYVSKYVEINRGYSVALPDWEYHQIPLRHLRIRSLVNPQTVSRVFILSICLLTDHDHCITTSHGHPLNTL